MNELRKVTVPERVLIAKRFAYQRLSFIAESMTPMMAGESYLISFQAFIFAWAEAVSHFVEVTDPHPTTRITSLHFDIMAW